MLGTSKKEPEITQLLQTKRLMGVTPEAGNCSNQFYSTFSQFRQHFTSSLCADILSPKNYLAKLKSCANAFVQKRLEYNVDEIDTLKYRDKLLYRSTISHRCFQKLGLCFNRAFHGFGQAKFPNCGSVFGSSHFSILPQLPPKILLNSKKVKIDPKIIILRH